MATCSRGWGRRCPEARGPECVCSCGGANHGTALTGGQTGVWTRAPNVVNTARMTRTPGPRPVLNATPGSHDGEIDLSWESLPNAKSYQIEKCLNPNDATGWSHSAVVTNCKATISGLTSGTRYWFRVATVGTGSPSGWSDPAAEIAP